MHALKHARFIVPIHEPSKAAPIILAPHAASALAVPPLETRITDFTGSALAKDDAHRRIQIRLDSPMLCPSSAFRVTVLQTSPLPNQVQTNSLPIYHTYLTKMYSDLILQTYDALQTSQAGSVGEGNVRKSHSKHQSQSRYAGNPASVPVYMLT